MASVLWEIENLGPARFTLVWPIRLEWSAGAQCLPAASGAAHPGRMFWYSVVTGFPRNVTLR
jgi:hypothetical protein